MLYSRDFGGIKSEGQLYNYEREYNESRRNENEYAKAHTEEELKPAVEKKRGFRLDFLRDLKLDDLILIAIGILLLLDSDGDNDMFVLILAFLLFF